MPAHELLLPERSVLVHIGPYKTGSTALQSALFAARDEMASYGVHYPGAWRRAAREGWAVLGWSPRLRSKTPPIELWESFAADVRSHDQVRVCVSTEDFATANEKQAGRIVSGLDPERVHVVVVARRYDQVLPSMWQERVKSALAQDLDAWLHDVLEVPTSNAAKRLWRAQDTVEVARQWLRWLPPERFHVVVSSSDRGSLLRTFEGLLGLPDELLQAQPSSNASLSANTVELVRRVNARSAEQGWSNPFHLETVYRGAVRSAMNAGAGPGDVRVPPVPLWARDRIVELSQQRVEGLRSLGVDVIGDLDALLVPDDAPTSSDLAFPTTVSLDQAEAALVGALEAARGLLDRAEVRQRQAVARARRRARRRAAGTGVDGMSSRELLRVVARRAAARLRRE